jgi:hypothetical protein
VVIAAECDRLRGMGMMTVTRHSPDFGRFNGHQLLRAGV